MVDDHYWSMMGYIIHWVGWWEEHLRWKPLSLIGVSFRYSRKKHLWEYAYVMYRFYYNYTILESMPGMAWSVVFKTWRGTKGWEPTHEHTHIQPVLPNSSLDRVEWLKGKKRKPIGSCLKPMLGSSCSCSYLFAGSRLTYPNSNCTTESTKFHDRHMQTSPVIPHRLRGCSQLTYGRWRP